MDDGLPDLREQAHHVESGDETQTTRWLINGRKPYSAQPWVYCVVRHSQYFFTGSPGTACTWPSLGLEPAWVLLLAAGWELKDCLIIPIVKVDQALRKHIFFSSSIKPEVD
jgi:hypothetical protein